MPQDTTPAAPSDALPGDAPPAPPPSDKLPDAPGLPSTLPGDDAPPSMPNDDPFKDEPESSPLAPVPTPESGADLREPGPRAQAEWRGGRGSQPAPPRQAGTEVLAANAAPGRLNEPGEAEPLPVPAERINPLRRATAGERSAPIVVKPAAFPSTQAESPGLDRAMRRNPLRAR
jgi:hypothetical protein